MIAEATLHITHPSGLHARPAALFYRKARSFKSRVTIRNLNRPESGELPVSPFNLLKIGVQQGHDVHIRAEGADANEVIAALTRLVEENFPDEL